MSNIIKIFKLDVLIIKEHIKVLIYLIVIGLFIVVSNKSLIAGIITTMTILPFRSTSILFQVEEKNNLYRFYSFIPVKKSELVLGRYAFIILSGFGILIISLLIQSLILNYIGITIDIQEYVLAFIFGFLTYLFTVSIQLPGFYKFGSINGSAFSYIPLIFLGISFYLTNSLDSFGFKTISLITNNNIYPSFYFDFC